MLERFYSSLYRIRRVEEKVAEIYPSDKIQSPVHLSIGQEAISVGVCAALRPEDVVFGSYRCHALYLAKGGDLKKMIAELYGKATGCAKGKAGSMHLIDASAGVMGASAVVSTTIPLAVGYAFAQKLQGKSTVVAGFFGDGAVEEGVFHEAVNFAALKKVPLLFICENNFYAIHSRQKDRQAKGDICALAKAHGVPAERIAEMDVHKIYGRVKEAVEDMRAGRSGPRLLECMCYRWMEHVGPGLDFQAGYRRRDEAEPWQAADPLLKLGKQLDAATRQRIEREVDAEIVAAFDFAERSPMPDDRELLTDLYKGAPWNG